MDVKKAFRTNEKKEIEGIWIQLDDKAAIKVARAGNPKFQRLFQKLTKPYRQAIRTGSLSEDVARKILIECMAETILLDWKGFEENGKEIKYSKEKSIEYLNIKDFRDFVAQCSEDFSLFKDEEDKQAEKN